MTKKQMAFVGIFMSTVIALSLAVGGGASGGKLDSGIGAQMCFQMTPYTDIFKLNATDGVVHGTMVGVDYTTQVMGKVAGNAYVLTARNPYSVGLGTIDGTIGFPNGNWWLTTNGDDLYGPSPVTLVPVSCTAPTPIGTGTSAFSK